VRQAVFNMLAPHLRGARWLDLCSGSGVMACEALQHGAAAVVAVEQDRRIAQVARANLALVAGGLSVSGSWTVCCREVVQWLEQEPSGRGFDLIYCDPPYAAGLHGAVAQALATGGWLRPQGLLLFECGTRMLPAIPSSWNPVGERRYGGTTVLVLRPSASAVEQAAPAILVPGGHEQPQQRHGNQTEHDAAEQGFDHG
jgi:16S rRNA (guanine(966)-N(2))-methyltransferase RsmD